jgi:hypothetical protein
MMFAPASSSGLGALLRADDVEAGFGRQDDNVKLGQLASADSTGRPWRASAYAEHVGRKGAHLPRKGVHGRAERPREAERGVRSNLVYALANVLLKLRQDYKSAGQGIVAEDLPTPCSNGGAPLVHRQLMLATPSDDVLDAPCLCGSNVRPATGSTDPEVCRSALETCPECAGATS